MPESCVDFKKTRVADMILAFPESPVSSDWPDGIALVSLAGMADRMPGVEYWHDGTPKIRIVGERLVLRGF